MSAASWVASWVATSVFGAVPLAALAQAVPVGSSPHASAASAASPARRSGLQDMSPRLQALQRDPGLNPAWLWIEEGRQRWGEAGRASTPACVSCHGPLEGMSTSAARHPRWHDASASPRTLQAQITECRRTRQGHEDARGDDGIGLSLAAALVAAGQGQPITPDPAAAMAAWARRGQVLWHTRMGQLNLSCAQCHDALAGQRLGGVRIPQAHDTGYPVYRMEWQGMGDLARRLRSCMTGVRAEPYAPASDEALTLEVYMRRRSSGLPLEAAAIRP